MSAHFDEIKKIIEKASHYIKRTFENDRLIKYGSIHVEFNWIFRI